MFFLLTKVVKTYTIKYYKEENRRKTWLSQTLKKQNQLLAGFVIRKSQANRISKETNAREMSIIALAQGRAKVKNISFETALGLIDFYEKNHEKFED